MTETDTLPPQIESPPLTAFGPWCNICGAARVFENVWICKHCDQYCQDRYCQVEICVSTRSSQRHDDEETR